MPQLSFTFRDSSGNPVSTDSEVETWNQIPGWPNHDVSDLGRIRSWKSSRSANSRKPAVPRILKTQRAKHGGYLTINPGDCELRGTQLVHRIVLLAFVGPCPEGYECRHLDGDRTNNRLSNLKWGTAAENTQDKIAHGTLIPWVPPEEHEPFMFTDPFIPVEAIMPVEVWKEIRGFPGYEVSNRARVKSFVSSSKNSGARNSSGYVMKLCKESRGFGYKLVEIIDCTGKPHKRAVHRFMIETFSPQDDPTLICRHVNGDSADNHLSNLRWSTHHENIHDKILHDTVNRGSRCKTTRLDEEKVAEIRRRLANDERPSKIAKIFGVSACCICDISHRRSWKHVK